MGPADIARVGWGIKLHQPPSHITFILLDFMAVIGWYFKDRWLVGEEGTDIMDRFTFWRTPILLDSWNSRPDGPLGGVKSDHWAVGRALDGEGDATMRILLIQVLLLDFPVRTSTVHLGQPIFGHYKWGGCIAHYFGDHKGTYLICLNCRDSPEYFRGWPVDVTNHHTC